MVGLDPERREDHEAEKHLADQAAEDEQGDEKGGEEMLGHDTPNQDYEPDLSGYVDEYRFVPLTPELEDALSRLVERVDDARGDTPRSEMRFHVKSGDDECRELAGLGYLSELTAYVNGDILASITPRGSRYESEKAAYVERRDRWVASRRRDRRRQLIFQLGIALLSFVGGIMCTLLGSLLQAILGPALS